MGHIVSEDGVATDSVKTAKVALWSELISVREVRQFLGLASYYHQFVKDFAIVGKPLPRLTEHAEDFKWTPDCQTAFETLRCLLVSVPVLAFPNFHRPFVLDTNASNTGIRAVLFGGQDGSMEMQTPSPAWIHVYQETHTNTHLYRKRASTEHQSSVSISPSTWRRVCY